MLSSFPSPPHLSLFRSAMRFPLCKHPPPPLSTEREDGRPTPSSVTFFFTQQHSHEATNCNAESGRGLFPFFLAYLFFSPLSLSALKCKHIARIRLHLSLPSSRLLKKEEIRPSFCQMRRDPPSPTPSLGE